MTRNAKFEALILATQPVGEDNRLATVLSPERGVFYAVAYGGRKGRLRSRVSPYHRGDLWLYEDKTKKSLKISDFEPLVYHSDIRNNLYKTYAAALCSELIIKTQGAIDSNALWILANAFLDGIDFCNEKEARLATLRFLWRFLTLMGLQISDFSCRFCASCTNLQYSIREAEFICTQCIHDTRETVQNEQHNQYRDYSHAYFTCGNEAVEYLKALNTQTPRFVRSLTLSTQSYKELHDFIFFLVKNATEKQIKSITSGQGIL